MVFEKPLSGKLQGLDATIQQSTPQEKEGNVLFNDALNTFYLRLYDIRHMVKDHYEREETRCRHIGYTLSD